MDAINWQPIDTAPLDDEVLVYINSATVDIVRLAFWSDGEFWQDQGFASQDDLRGWWSYKHSVTQEKLDEYMTPTHWASFNPPKDAP